GGFPAARRAGRAPCIPAAMARPTAIRTMPRITAPQPRTRPASARPAPCSPVRLIWLRAMWVQAAGVAPAGELAQVQRVRLACQAAVPGQEPGERQPFGIAECWLDGDEGGCGGG